MTVTLIDSFKDTITFLTLTGINLALTTAIPVALTLKSSKLIEIKYLIPLILGLVIQATLIHNYIANMIARANYKRKE